MNPLKIDKNITIRTDTLTQYLMEIGRIKLLTPDEEVILAQKIRAGSHEALQKLVSANLRFVVSVSKQYQNQGLSLSDLISWGNAGMIKAATRFDETRGFKFISYAVWWIQQSILQGIYEESRTVRMPLNQITALSKINQGVEKFQQQAGREPTNEELAQIIDLSAEDIEDAKVHKYSVLYLSRPLVEGEEETHFDVFEDTDSLPPDKGVFQESFQKEIEKGLRGLTGLEREVVTLFFGLQGKESMTIEQLAEKYNKTRERIRQIKNKGIGKLKKPAVKRNLRPYLE